MTKRSPRLFGSISVSCVVLSFSYKSYPTQHPEGPMGGLLILLDRAKIYLQGLVLYPLPYPLGYIFFRFTEN